MHAMRSITFENHTIHSRENANGVGKQCKKRKEKKKGKQKEKKKKKRTMASEVQGTFS